MRLSRNAKKILLQIYKNYLLRAIDHEICEIDSDATGIAPEHFCDAWDELRGDNKGACVFVDAGFIRKQPGYANIHNVKISALGIKFVEQWLMIEKERPAFEKMNWLIYSIDKMPTELIVGDDILVDEAYANVKDNLVEIVWEAEKWLQSKETVCTQQLASAKIIYTADFVKTRSEIAQNTRNPEKELPNGEYIRAKDIKENLGEDRIDTILINLPTIMEKREGDISDLLKGDGKDILISIVIHEISHCYDMQWILNPLWDIVSKHKSKDKLLRVFQCYTESRSKYFQELYYIEHVSNKIDHIKWAINNFQDKPETEVYCIAHQMGQIMSWKKNNKNIGMDDQLYKKIEAIASNMLKNKKKRGRYLAGTSEDALERGRRFFSLFLKFLSRGKDDGSE